MGYREVDEENDAELLKKDDLRVEQIIITEDLNIGEGHVGIIDDPDSCQNGRK